ncbi:hypothetical protein DRE_00924 [Drechslerella stenobrocha 248]|uniref:Uncharacterized protein n=1 Tax=Drechslerella stenobrocha 248 TaxID=1043628 RepID=W7I7B1_9PEZI|nr:hypothetical protein DRE_00924 [Drechslerella stenobrocha 248]
MENAYYDTKEALLEASLAGSGSREEFIREVMTTAELWDDYMYYVYEMLEYGPGSEREIDRVIEDGLWQARKILEKRSGPLQQEGIEYIDDVDYARSDSELGSDLENYVGSERKARDRDQDSDAGSGG